MQLPSTGPLKLAIRWQRNRLNLKMISQIQIRSVFDHRAAGFGSNSQHCEVQTCRRLIPPKCIFVRYLCGINYRTEFVDPQVRHCKKLFPEPHLEDETLRPLEILVRNGNIFDAIFGIFHIYCYISSFSSPTLARGFVAFPEGSAIWAPGRNVKAGKDQQLVDDLDRPGNGARTLGSHQIPGIRR